MLYVPKGGVIKLDFEATDKQIDIVSDGLEELGLVKVDKSKVKSEEEAAAGSMLSAAAVAARYAAPSAFVAARKRVYGDPRTLYGRGGGIFGLARLSDRLMDVWMANPKLNANAKVAKWHESDQKFGFKFLVTQIFCYLTGGPQRYTGKPMDVAHKHLGITDGQWQHFMHDASKVYREFSLEWSVQEELRHIFDGFKTDIIVPTGEKVP